MFTIRTKLHRLTSAIQRQATTTGSCGRVNHSTDDTNGRRIVEHAETNPVCWPYQLTRRGSMTRDPRP
ncbi:hypothetical protein TNCV_2365491 [Trichonephila clavipes]|nr:hypothetical protein TNCV_2365491 [Trichonephila clavipes]